MVFAYLSFCLRRALDTLTLSEAPNFSHTTSRQRTEIDYEEKNHLISNEIRGQE